MLAGPSISVGLNTLTLDFIGSKREYVALGRRKCK